MTGNTLLEFYFGETPLKKPSRRSFDPRGSFVVKTPAITTQNLNTAPALTTRLE